MIDNGIDDDAEVLNLESKTSSWICQQQREESGVRIGLFGTRRRRCFIDWGEPEGGMLQVLAKPYGKSI